MTVSCNPAIPISGLVQCLDASNPRSYPGSGLTWYDLSSNGHNITLGSSVSYQSGVGNGVLQFTTDGNSYGRNTSLNLSSSNNTVVSFVRKLDTNSGRTITAYNNNWLMAHHNSGTWGDYYAEGWVNDSSSGPNITTWRMFTATGDISNDTWAIYANETLLASNSNGAGGPNGWNLNAQYSQYSNCQISNLIVYNRVLTTSEISQLFNAYRGRFGI